MGVITRLITITLLLGFAWSCAKTQIKVPEHPFYLTPKNTYLRDSPGFGGNVLGHLYKGDEVKILEANETSWWRVELQRTGQQGWIQKELLSPEPVSPVFYYISEDNVGLLECPRKDCMSLQRLFRGDQVQRVEEGAEGWWRVLVVKSRSLGWVPAAALAASLEEAQAKKPEKPYYYVAIRKLKLRARPVPNAEVVRTLQFNDQVQKIEQNSQGWFKVRQPSTGAFGWVSGRNLETLPLIAPRGERPAKEGLKPFKQREEPQLEPEFI